MILEIFMKMINSNKLKNSKYIKQFKYQNKEKEIEIIEMKSLKQKLKNNIQYYSFITFFINSNSINQCIKHEFYINQQ